MLGLKRIALHNSYFSGLSVMFDADGHSNASGGNGAGKTSALNLIPIFYGTEPNQLVDQVADKDSFLDFYLPKQSSALIYEHLREDGHRLVVMYRHSSGAKTIYRFVTGSLEETFFHPTITPLLERGSAITEVFMALKDMGIRLSRQIDTITDYRALIQNDKKLLRRRGSKGNNESELAREYCLGGPNDHMSHLDRMSYAILRRADMFDRLKKMIAETQFNDIHIDERPEHLKDKTLVQDIAGLRDFDSAELKIRLCIEKHQQRDLVISDRVIAVTELKYRCLEASDQAETLKNQIETLTVEITALDEVYKSESLQLRENALQLQSQAKQLDDEINGIHDENRRWQGWNVTEKKAQYDNLDHHIDRLQQFESDLELLTKQVNNLESALDSGKYKAQENLDKDLKKLSAKKLELREQQNELVIKFADAKAEVTSQKHKAITELIEGENAKQRQELNNLIVKTGLQSGSVQITNDDQKALDLIEAQIDEASEKLEVNEFALANSKSELDTQNDKHKAALKALQYGLDETKDLQKAYDELNALIYPKDGTLLSDLRLFDPAWAETIGKILDPELLLRTDLQPDYKEGLSGTIYGWHLALQNIDTPPHATREDVLLARLEQADTRLRSSQKRCDELESAANELFKAIKPLETKYAELKHHVKQQGDSIKALRDRYKRTKAIAQEKAEERQVQLLEEVKSLKKALKDHDERTTELKREIESSFNQTRLELDSRQQSESQNIEERINLLVSQEKQSKADFQTRVKQIEVRFTVECEKAGVDPNQIRTARKTKNDQYNLVETIRGYTTELQKYESWCKNFWSKVPEKDLLISELRSKASSAQEDIQIHNKKHHQAKNGIETQRRESLDKLKELKPQIENANNLISQCPVSETAEEEPSGSLLDLTDKLSRLISEEKQLKKEVIEGVNNAQAILNKYINSRIYKAWESLLEQRRSLSHSDEFSDEFRLKQPLDLAHLLDHDLPAIRDVLIQQVRAVGDSLSKYHDCLKGLNDEVSRVSRLLGQRVNTNQRIENLTNIELQVTSVVVEGDYWDKLSSFNEQWREWQDGRDFELPPEALLYAIQSANEALQNARISNDINSLIRLRICLEENGRKAHVESAKEFDALSSNGLSYLAILVIFMGMARYLCPNNQISLHWPIDELAALSPENIARLFHMFEEAGIYCFSAFPSTDQNLLKFFKHRKLIDRKRGVRNLTDPLKNRSNSLKGKLSSLAVEAE
ncbi:ATP-binding protein [Pontibacter sp. JAM-7]|uniref:ATP-binding protein n=1 Tax=Pontibacter sp. JAM-7 TaxID=3366581 RepID=UPI003AF89C67